MLGRSQRSVCKTTANAPSGLPPRQRNAFTPAPPPTTAL